MLLPIDPWPMMKIIHVAKVRVGADVGIKQQKRDQKGLS
jgi:hypothetical protein